MYSWMLRNLALPVASSVSSSRFWDAYREMVRLEQAPLGELRRIQWERLSRLLHHAYDNVAFHRERMDAAGLRPSEMTSPEDLLRLPPTTKADVQRHFPDRVTSGDRLLDDWKYVSTSGTANRLMVIQDFHKRDMVRAATTRSLYLSGGYQVGARMVEIPPDICNIVCGAEGESLDGVLPHLWQMTRHWQWRDEKAMSALRGRVERNWVFRKKTYQPFGPQGTNLTEDHMQGYVDALRRDRPYVLKALPTYLYEIARWVVERGERPLDVKVVKPMGASVSPRMREVIEAGFAGRYREEYGSAEFGDMACDCDHSDGLHLFMDLYYIEVVRDGRLASDGELGRVLITDLSNLAMPMIRYDIGDTARISHTDHGCGRSSPRLFPEGRAEDTLVNRQGEWFSSDSVIDFFHHQAGVDQFQLLEQDTGFELLVVPREGEVVDRARLGEALAEFLGEEDLRLSIYEAKTIKPEASGKFRFVQSRSHARMGAVTHHA